MLLLSLGGTVFATELSSSKISYNTRELVINVAYRGAVAVSMDIKVLDVNQCPGKYYTPNAFKRTHKCDDKTSYVSMTMHYHLLTILAYS